MLSPCNRTQTQIDLHYQAHGIWYLMPAAQLAHCCQGLTRSDKERVSPQG